MWRWRRGWRLNNSTFRPTWLPTTSEFLWPWNPSVLTTPRIFWTAGNDDISFIWTTTTRLTSFGKATAKVHCRLSTFKQWVRMSWKSLLAQHGIPSINSTWISLHAGYVTKWFQLQSDRTMQYRLRKHSGQMKHLLKKDFKQLFLVFLFPGLTKAI